MIFEVRNHAGRTRGEQLDHERRCAVWERREAHMRANVERMQSQENAAQAWGEW